MKILIISNLYPPKFLGGYEIRCAQVVEALHRRGHDVRVLTSVFGLPIKFGGRFQQATENVGGIRVDRLLHNYSFGPQPPYRPWMLFQAMRELSDARNLVEVLSEFEPDVVNCWNLNGIAKLLLAVLQSRDIPTVHWIEDSWMINDYGPAGEKAAQFWYAVWEGRWGPSILRQIFKQIGNRWEARVARKGLPTRSFSGQPALVSFVSEYMRTIYSDAGLRFPASSVQFGGIPRDRFYVPLAEKPRQEQLLRVLYAGQISLDRGLHTLVEALGWLAPSYRRQVSVTVAGIATGVHDNYYRQVVSQVRELGLTEMVRFTGKVGHDDMARLYKNHDLLVFTSTRPEGLPLVMAEAMVAGCAVITTGSGGAQEIADLGQLPVFPKGDSRALARLLEQLVTNHDLLREIAERGQVAALRELTLEGMIESWECTLAQLARPSSCRQELCVQSPLGRSR